MNITLEEKIEIDEIDNLYRTLNKMKKNFDGLVSNDKQNLTSALPGFEIEIKEFIAALHSKLLLVVFRLKPNEEPVIIPIKNSLTKLSEQYYSLKNYTKDGSLDLSNHTVQELLRIIGFNLVKTKEILQDYDKLSKIIDDVTSKVNQFRKEKKSMQMGKYTEWLESLVVDYRRSESFSLVQIETGYKKLTKK